MLAVAGWDGWISLLPLAAAINSTAALFYAKNREMRIRLLGSSLLWIGTGLYWHSWPIMLTEVIAISINLRTILRLQKT
jgi:Bacterial inner membrane protein